MERNSQEISKEMNQTKEGHFDKATSTNEKKSPEKLVNTGVLSDEGALLFKRKSNLYDHMHFKKHKATTETILREELSNNEVEQVSEVEGNPSSHVSRENLQGGSSKTNYNSKQINEPKGMSGKGCYVTFSDELSAEKAVCFSGYRLKIYNKDEVPYNGILSVDYAEAELDEDCLNPSQDANDPDIENSDYEFNTLLEKVKNENTFSDGLSDAIGLLKQKKNSKKNTIDLFPLMRNIYCHVLYLVVEKGNFELDVTKSKFAVVKQIQKTCELLVDIELAFKLSLEISNQSCFTKQQRNNIEIWKKHCREYITLFMEEVASYETSLEEQNNHSMENIELHQENMFPECDVEDSEECNQENQNQKDNYLCPGASFPPGYNDEVLFINDKLNKEETFLQAANTLITWLENDICSNENARSFFSMMQSIHNHVMKLCDKKDKYEETLKDAKVVLIKHFEEILFNLLKVERIYLTITLEKFINYFTLAERKNIELWLNYANKLKSNLKEKIRKFRREEKVNRNKNNGHFYKQLNENIQKLKEQHSSLQCQFKEVRNNITFMKCTYKKDFERLDDELAALNRAMSKSQKVVLKLREKCFVNEVQLRELRNSIYQQNVENEVPDHPIPQDLARVIALISIFLRSCPGASIDSILSYLHGIDTTIDCSIIENVMRRFSAIFQERIIGVGANLQKKWYYVAV